MDLKRVPDIERWADHALIRCVVVAVSAYIRPTLTHPLPQYMMPLISSTPLKATISPPLANFLVYTLCFFLALISYLKIIVAINRNQRIINYRTDDRLTQNGARDFKVRMGFGLHAGWAIEGAVGSLQKVDAT